MVPLGLLERLFHSRGGGELGFWTPQPRNAGAANPTWLDEFYLLQSAAQQQQQHVSLKTWGGWRAGVLDTAAAPRWRTKPCLAGRVLAAAAATVACGWSAWVAESVGAQHAALGPGIAQRLCQGRALSLGVLGGGGELGLWTPQPRQAGAPNPTCQAAGGVLAAAAAAGSCRCRCSWSA
jgi:hypothetical protein